MRACPPREQLEQLLAGELVGAAEQAASEHVEGCPVCQACLEALTAGPLGAGPVRPESRAPSHPPSGSSRPRPSDDQLHRLKHLLPPDHSGERPGLPAQTPTPTPAWPVIPGYEIVRELGQGGMAIVYEARDVRLNRRTALKMVHSGELATPEHLVRFRSEGEILARLRHPNIVQIYEVGTHGKQPYMALELMEGGSLAKALGGRPMPPRPAAALVETLARAVEYAHGQGIVHRDLNPANVLLGNSECGMRNSGLHSEFRIPHSAFQPKVSDFGLARHLSHDSRLTQTGHVMGTPSYMAPEQVRGRADEVGPPTDIYALGAILYETLAGRPPFQAPTTLEVMNQVAEREPVPPSHLFPGVPRDLEVICLKCLEKTPARRYPSAAAVADDLRRFLDGRPIQARRVATVERAWRWAKRRPAVAGLLLGVAVALVGGTAVSVYYATEAGVRARDAERAGEERQRALDVAQEARRQSDLRSAELLFRAGLDHCEAGTVDRGLFDMLEAWRSAPEDAGEFRRLVRTNLAAWGRQLPVLEQVLQHPQRRYVLTRFVGPPGKELVTWDIPNGRDVVRWDLATGQPVGTPFVAPAGEEVMDINPDGTRVTTTSANRTRARDLSTGRPVTPDFEHHPPGQPRIGGFALFSGLDGVVTTKTLQTGVSQRFRQFWRLPPRPGTAETLDPPLTIRLEQGDTYHVTSAAGKPVAVVFRHQLRTPDGGPPQAEFWDLSTGDRLPALPTPVARTDPRISWDGRTVLSINSPEMVGFHAAADGAVRWWQTTTGRLVGEPWRPRRPAQYATLADDGQLLVTRGDDHRVRLFDLGRGHQRGGDILTTGYPEREFAPRVGVGPDGSRVATGSMDGVVRVWQGRQFLPQNTLAANPRVPISTTTQVRFDAGRLAPDLRTGLVAATGAGVGRFATPSGEVGSAPLRQTHLHFCAFSPDGALVATAPDNNTHGGRTVVTVWDRSGGAPPVVLNQYRYIHSLAFSPDGRTLAVGCVGGTFLWEVRGWRPRHLLRESTTARELVFSPDGTRLAVVNVAGWAGAGAGVRLWDVATGRPVGELLAGKHAPRIRPFFVAAFAGGGETLRVFDLLTGQLHARDARTGAPRHEPPVLAPADEAAFTADGATLATGHSNGSVQQWNAATGGRAGGVCELTRPTTRLAYGPNGRILAVACRDQSVRLWDAGSCFPLGPPLLHRAELLDLRFTPDGGSLVTLTATGRTHTWPLPRPVADDPERMGLWIRSRGGIGLENGSVVLLDPETWRAARDRFRGRWPEPDPALPAPDDEAGWHDARARDAEEDDNTFAALWHLNRLAALRPGDWQVPARQGLLYAASGEFALAESAYRQGATIAPTSALRDWYRQGAAACLTHKQWAAALRHLDWLAAAGGEDWQLHADRATAFGQLNQIAERDAARARAVELGADAAFLVPLAEERAAQGRWAEAAALFARATERGGLDVMDECRHALTRLKVGEDIVYRQICTRLVEDLGADRPATAAFRRGGLSNMLVLFRACVLRPDAVTDWQPLMKLADDILAVPMRELALAPEPQLANMRLDWLAARGAVLYRTGRYEEAVTCLRESASTDRKTDDLARVFLALAHQKLGQPGEARRWAEKVAPAGAGFSWEAVEAELLRPLLAEVEKAAVAPRP